MKQLENWEVHYLVMLAMSPAHPSTDQVVRELTGDARVIAMLILGMNPDELRNQAHQQGVTLDFETLQETAVRFREMAETRRLEHQLRTHHRPVSGMTVLA